MCTFEFECSGLSLSGIFLRLTILVLMAAGAFLIWAGIYVYSELKVHTYRGGTWSDIEVPFIFYPKFPMLFKQQL